jgi:hypothetical protein
VFVGGIFGRWEFMVTDCDDSDGPVHQIGIAESNADPDETVLHRRAFEIVSEDIARFKPLYSEKDKVVPIAYKLEKLKKSEFEGTLQKLEVADMNEDKVGTSSVFAAVFQLI